MPVQAQEAAAQKQRAAEEVEVAAPKLSDIIKAKLGKSDRVKLGDGEVISTGFSFYDRVEKKPQTVMVPSNLSADSVFAGLLSAGHFNVDAAYEVNCAAIGKPLTLSTYHTKTAFGDAPALRVGDIVQVYVVRTKSGYGIAYQTLKGTK